MTSFSENVAKLLSARVIPYGCMSTIRIMKIYCYSPLCIMFRIGEVIQFVGANAVGLSTHYHQPYSSFSTATSFWKTAYKGIFISTMNKKAVLNEMLVRCLTNDNNTFIVR